MVTTRSLPKRDSEKEAADHISSDEEPQPVSSDSEAEETTTISATVKEAGMSRLFAPYRTVGVVSSQHPFSLIAHQNSQSSMLCIPTGERFQFWQTDKLQPVLVSQAVPSSSKKRRNNVITRCIPDASLQITVVAHGGYYVTLYRRTTPVATTLLPSSSRRRNSVWKMQDMLHLGRIPVPMTGEKEGQTENGALVAVVLARHDDSDHDEDDDDESQPVPVVGMDEDSSMSDSSSGSSDE